MEKDFGECNSCLQNLTKLVCDWCGEDVLHDTVKIQFGYGSKFDGEGLDFCRDKCMIDYVREVVNRKWMSYVEKGNVVPLEWKERKCVAKA